MSPVNSSVPAKAGKPSAYQLQGTGRAKRVTKQVAVADTRVRAATRILTDALALASTAAAAVAVVNKTYGTSYPTTTRYVDAVTGAGVADVIARASEAAPTAEYPPVIGAFDDSKDGAALPGQAVLGEYEAPADSPPGKTPKAKSKKDEAMADTAPE